MAMERQTIPFRINPFYNGLEVQEKLTGILKSYLPCQKCQKNLQAVSSPFKQKITLPVQYLELTL